MKQTFLLLLLGIAFTGLNAQNSKPVISESGVGEKYRFTIRVDGARSQQLVDAFTEISETDVNRAFSGHWGHTTKDGIRIKLNTNRGLLTFRYDGRNKKVIARARAKADTVREYFD